MVLNSDKVNCLLELMLRNAPIFSYTRQARRGGVYMTVIVMKMKIMPVCTESLGVREDMG